MSQIFVCGLGRCGTSMMMQMLDAAGVPTFGDYPAYEPEEMMIPVDMLRVLPLLEGRAAKVLDAHRATWPKRLDAHVIWLDRNTTEQAKSQIKMLTLMAGFHIPGGAWRSVRSALPGDRRDSLMALEDIGCRILVLTFERILSDPRQVAQDVAAFLGQPLDIDSMANVIVPRPPKCAPALDMELRLCALAAMKQECPALSSSTK